MSPERRGRVDARWSRLFGDIQLGKTLSAEEIGRLRRAQIEAVFALTPTLVAANAITAVVFFSLFERADNVRLLGLWLVAVFAALTIWLARWRRAQLQPPGSMASRAEIRRFCLGAAAAGLLWSAPIVATFPQVTHNGQIVLASLAASLVSAGALALATIWEAALAFATAVMAPTVIALLHAQIPVAFEISGLSLAYAVLMSHTVYARAKLFVESHLSTAALREQTEIVGVLLKDFEDNANDFLWETDAQGCLRRVSHRLAELIGVSQAQLEGFAFAALLTTTDYRESEIDGGVAARLAARQPFRDQLFGLSVRGERRVWSVTGKPIVDYAGRFQGFRGVGSDVTDAERIANRDVLTDLPNRSCFQRVAQLRLARRRETGEPSALITLDLDRFKRVNDTLGHPVGDALLRAAANRVAACLDPGDIVSRYGGDEFVVLSRAGGVEDSAALATRLVEALCAPFDIDGFRVMSGASVGIALAPADADSFEELLRKSDLALYRAKSDGRGRFLHYKAALDNAMQARRQLEMDLRNVEHSRQLLLHFQPLVDTGTGLISTCEALVRWRHPTLGQISPQDFISIAEEAGYIGALGQWVLEEACREAAKWPGDTRVAVNVSPIQFRSADLESKIRAALAMSGLHPSRLEIELTESVLIGNREETFQTLQSLRALGVRISLDDFGTGYSSFSYLCSFPFDKIKIDKTFVYEIEKRANSAAVVRSIASLAETLGISLAAEGVETEEQLAWLSSNGCSEVQGYLISRPLPARDMAELLARARGRGVALAAASARLAAG